MANGRVSKSRATLCVAVLAAAGLAAATGQTPAPKPPRFDVVSIKPGDANARNPRFGSRANGRFSVENQTTLQVILTAYDLDQTRLLNIPDWVKHERYSIDAEPPDSLPSVAGAAAQQRLQQMLQAMLAARFGFAAHRETRIMEVYDLVVAKGGSKFPPPAPAGQPPPVVGPLDAKNPARFRPPGAGEVSAGILGVANLPKFLARQLGRPVIDKTGITGEYEMRLIWQPVAGEAMAAAVGSAAAQEGGPSIFTALEEQLGLRLEAAKAPVEVLVIDRISRPTPN
ncbi:MAG TPA: TIGR03435 family protein [Terriglobales bacterium]|nr:TIGR03435 family protein [Terriglobales bacterium]